MQFSGRAPMGLISNTAKVEGRERKKGGKEKGKKQPTNQGLEIFV